MTQDTFSGPFKCGEKKTSVATDCHKLIHDTNDSGIFECIDESKFIRRIAGTLEQVEQTSFITTEKESQAMKSKEFIRSSNVTENYTCQASSLETDSQLNA